MGVERVLKTAVVKLLAGTLCVWPLVGMTSGNYGVKQNETASRPIDGDYDLVIYGGTPSGVAAAVAANGSLKRILLISERTTVGGAMSNGLGAVDVGARFAVTGISREFFGKVERHYRDHTMWRTEPHIAESIFRGMLAQTSVELATQRNLTHATVENDAITCLTLDHQDRVCANLFIDASYTGDLIEASGARNVLGPSDLYSYSEPEANRRHFAIMGDFRQFSKNEVHSAIENVPYIGRSAMLPNLKEMLHSANPSWTYRLCITRDKMREFRPGVDYAKYVRAWRVLIKAQYARGLCRLVCGVRSNGTIQTILWQIVRLPHGKFDLNAGTAQLSNFPIPRDYFVDSSSRNMHEQQLQGYLESFLYFAQNDSQVPAFERQALAGFGLCADEFVDNNNWPYSPYVREGRRLIGVNTLTTEHIMHKRVSSDAVAIGAYPLDSKSSLLVYWNGRIYRDVGSFLKAPIYEIPYSTMLPAHGPSNLLSSVNIAASPTAFGSVRVESQFMQLGQVAGTAAMLASAEGRSFAAISIPKLRRDLKSSGLTTSIEALCHKMTHKSRIANAFDPVSCEPLTYAQETPYDDLYGKLTR